MNRRVFVAPSAREVHDVMPLIRSLAVLGASVTRNDPIGDPSGLWGRSTWDLPAVEPPRMASVCGLTSVESRRYVADRPEYTLFSGSAVIAWRSEDGMWRTTVPTAVDSATTAQHRMLAALIVHTGQYRVPVLDPGETPEPEPEPVEEGPSGR